MDGQYLNLWSTDNDKTDANDDVVIKSVYDPSPVGYSLPASNAFRGFSTTGNGTNNSSEYNVKGTWDKGWWFCGKANKSGTTIFFPASGYRYYDTGSLYEVATSGFCWVSSTTNTYNGRFLYFDSNSVSPLNITYCNYGLPVRSAEEKK